MFHIVLSSILIIEDCSENIFEFTGINKSKVINNHISTIDFLKPCADMVEKNIKSSAFDKIAFLEESKRDSVLVKIKDCHGKEKVYQCFFDVYLDCNGKVGKVMIYFLDKYKECGDYYQRVSMDVFKILFDRIQTGLVIADLDGKYLKLNDAFCDMLGYDKEELLGKSYQEITHPDDIDGDDQNVQKLLKGDIDHFKMSKRYISKSGLIIYVVIVVNLIRKPNGEPEYFISSVQDETKMVEYSNDLEKELLKMEDILRSKSVYIRNISHELRNSLNAMVNTAKLLEESRLDKDQRVLVRVFKDSSLVLLNLINDMLDLSVMENNRFTISESPMDLKQLVAEVADMFIFESRSKGICLNIDISGVLVSKVLGDFARIKQVIVNIVNNSFKFTTNGSVSIVCKSEMSSEGVCIVVISVLDTGIGIVESEKDRIFDAFYQIDRSGNKSSGIGVGLSIVKNIVDLMKGDIDVVSKLGEGTHFTITLKLRPVESKLCEEKSIEDNQNQSEVVKVEDAIKVLLVEDNDINRYIFVKVLKKLNCEVVALEDGSHVSQLIDIDRFDVIFMDVYMPVLDGFKASEKIRAMPGRYVPIIGITASASKDDYDKAMKSGMDELLIKPVDIDDIRSVLKLYAQRQVVQSGKRRNLNISQYFEAESVDEDVKVQMYNLMVSNVEGIMRKIYENIEDKNILPELLHELLGVCKVVGDFETERIINKWSSELEVVFERGHRQMFLELSKSVRSFLGRSDWMLSDT